MARTAQISKEKWQSTITLRHEGQSIWKISKTLKVSPSAVAKTIKRYEESGSHEDRHRNGRPRVTSAADEKLIRVTSLRNCSPNNCFTEFKWQTHLNINCSEETAWIRPLWLNSCNNKKTLLKDTNNKKRLAWAKKHVRWTLDRENLSFGLMSANLRDLFPTAVSLWDTE